MKPPIEFRPKSLKPEEICTVSIPEGVTLYFVGKKPFDKTVYQREYMRKVRAKIKEAKETK